MDVLPKEGRLLRECTLDNLGTNLVEVSEHSIMTGLDLFFNFMLFIQKQDSCLNKEYNLKTEISMKAAFKKRSNSVMLANKSRDEFEETKKEYLGRARIFRLHSQHQPQIKINVDKLKSLIGLEKQQNKYVDRNEVTFKRSFSTQNTYKTNPKIQGLYESVLKPNDFININHDKLKRKQLHLYSKANSLSKKQQRLRLNRRTKREPYLKLNVMNLQNDGQI